MFRDSAYSWRPIAAPSIEDSVDSPSSATWATVSIPVGVQLFRRASPHAPRPTTAHRRRIRFPAPDRAAPAADRRASASWLATFARNFVRTIPTVMGRPTRSRTSARSLAAIFDGRARDPDAGRRRRGTPRPPRGAPRLGWCRGYLGHIVARPPIGLHPSRHHHGVRAHPAPACARRRGADPVGLGLVTGRQDHATTDIPGARAAPGHRAASTESASTIQVRVQIDTSHRTNICRTAVRLSAQLRRRCWRPRRG